MKKYILIVSSIVLISTIQSCKNDDEAIEDSVIATDISISSNQNSIVYVNNEDLTQQIENALNVSYGSASASEVEVLQEFDADVTQVTASVDFKEEFQDVYEDTNITNNSVSIDVSKKVTTIVELKADGPGDTYELITSVLAPNRSPIEVPDCGHLDFGNHIDELFDADLDAYVFRFFIHVTPDNDRCKEGVDDRQRNEIKTYDGSPENLQGQNGETFVYNWKFKLPIGFQSSSNFTHIHQIKSVGGNISSIPIYALTTRKGSPDQLELRYAETDRQITLTKIDITPLLGNWVEVTETVSYGTEGTYDIVIKKVEDQSELLAYASSSIINWREGASFARPKWGVYRSLLTSENLRDEEVLFADFSITEIKYE